MIDKVLPTVLNDLWFGDLTLPPTMEKTKPIIAKTKPNRLVPWNHERSEKIKPVKADDFLLSSKACSSSGERTTNSCLSFAINTSSYNKDWKSQKDDSLIIE